MEDKQLQLQSHTESIAVRQFSTNDMNSGQICVPIFTVWSHTAQ